MKQQILWTWSLALALAVLPLAGGCDQESAHSAPVITSDTNQPSSTVEPAGNTNAPSPEAAEEQLENAPGQILSAAAVPPQNVNLTAPSADVLKLARGSVDESVMLSFVTNSPHTFNLDSDAIVYLNDTGVPGTVVTAMIQHDQALKASSAAGWAPPVYNGQSAPATGTSASSPAPDSATETTGSEPSGAVVEGGQPPEQANVASAYFYDSLAPYGNWVNIGGYGMCWQPTVVAANPAWRPYCDRGYWAYSDCGWYWVSDYTWGWAPFHYGRWFHHRRWGWCWAPDTVWGPAWVSWRYTPSYCGWAPLPPTACFTPGVGFTYFGTPVGFSFSFGLPLADFAFVGMNFVSDHHLRSHLVAERDVHGFFDHSVMGRGVLGQNRTFINAGVPVSRVAAAAHTQIHRLQIRDAAGPTAGRFDRVERDGRSLTVFRPNLPTPTHQTVLVGQGISLAPRRGSLPPAGRAPAFTHDAGRQQFGIVDAPVREHQAGTIPVFRNQPVSVQNPMRLQQSLTGGRQMPSTQNNSRLVQNQIQQQNVRVFRQDTPYFQNREQQTFIQPSATAQQPPAIRTSAWTPSAESRELERRATPMPEAAMPAIPRVETRQVPGAGYSAPAHSHGSTQNPNTRQNH
jgi:hypothetical protein